jgi:ABC-type uncharacterized transport system auxiliary subunit
MKMGVLLSLVSACCVLLAGCFSAGVSAQKKADALKRTYLPVAVATVPVVERPLLPAIKLRAFTALSPYDSLQFVVRRANGETALDYYRGWVAAPQDLIRSQTGRYLEQTGLFEAMYDASSGTQPAWGLEGTVVECFLDYQGAEPAVQMTLRLLVLDEESVAFNVVFATQATARVPLQSQGEDSAVQAFNVALSQVLAECAAKFKTATFKK